MTKKKTAPATARGTRTGVQGGVAGAIVALLASFGLELTETQVGLAIVILTALFSYVQTVVEDHYGKALLREVPEGDQPVADA